MKNLTLTLLVALFATVYTNDVFVIENINISESYCDDETKMAKFFIDVTQTKGMSPSENILFNMTLLGSDFEYYPAMCTIEITHGETDKENEDLKNEKESEDENLNIEFLDIEDQAAEKEDQAVEKEDQAEDKDDKKEDQAEGEKKAEKPNETTKDENNENKGENGGNSYCLFTPKEDSGPLNYTIMTISVKEGIEIYNDYRFNLIAQNCAPSNLWFRQINGFKYENGEISFNFYGITFQNITKKVINLFVQLYFDGELENEIKEAICTQNKEVQLKNNKPVQVSFECKITKLEKEYTSFSLYRASLMDKVPYDDEVLIDPVKTEEAIKEGTLLDYSLESNQVVPSIFEPTSVEESKCSLNGKLKITGHFDSEFEGSTDVIIRLSFSDQFISCDFPSAEENEDVSIECKFISDAAETAGFIYIDEQTVKKNGKELLIIKSITSDEEIDCISSEAFDKRAKKNLKVSFRQINHFKYENKKVTFDIFGLTSQSLEVNFEFVVYVYLISGEVKETEEREAKCVLGTGVTLSSGQKLVQAPFSCSISGLEKEYTSLEISYSKEIAGIPDDILLLDPVKTEHGIETNILTDFSENPSVPSSFTPGSVDVSKCPEKGELSISGEFDKALTTKVEFLIISSDLSLARFKCSISPGQSVINCVSNDDINIRRSLIFEQQVIYKRWI